MALSYALHYIESNNHAKIINYSEYLANYPPTYAVEIFKNSSWSCIHGVERWRNNCGCHSGSHPGWNQEWRKHLRNAMDWLRDRFIHIYSEEASKYLKKPWETRNDYIEVIFDRSRENVENFLAKHAVRELTKEENIAALKLLEIQRNAMLMYTSCGWFFDEISGIETVQILQYASKAIQYAQELMGLSLETEYLQYLKEAPSNVYKNAAEIYDMFVKPTRTDILRVGAHYSISSIFENYPEEITLYCYTAKSDMYNKMEAGKLKLIIGKTKIRSNITWDEMAISFAVLHLGDHNINAGVKYFNGDSEFTAMQDEIKNAFEKGDIPEVVRLMDKHFENNIYSLLHLFKDEQRKVLDQILQLTYESVEASYRHIYDDNFTIMNFYHSLQRRLPRPFSLAAEYILNRDLKKFFEDENPDVEKLKRLIEETKRWSSKVDTTTIGFIASSWVNSIMEKLNEDPEDIELFEKISNTLEVSIPLSLSLDLWKAQNIYFSIGRSYYQPMKEKAAKNDSSAQRWVESFHRLGYFIHVKIQYKGSRRNRDE
jgi:hypothetical protein